MGRRRGRLRADSSGYFFRQIGQKPGVSSQPKFYLGKDSQKAELAYQRLGALWDTVVALHSKRGRSMATEFAPPNVAVPVDEPKWDEETLCIAEAVRKHQHSVRMPCPPQVIGEAAYAHHLDYLQEAYGHIITILPEDAEAAAKGRDQHAHYAQHYSQRARNNARVAQIAIPAGVVGSTLYQALDAYAVAIRQSNQKESGKVESGNALRLKNSTTDMDLSEFGYSAMERIRDYWASRPEAKLRGGKLTGRPISLTSVDNHLSTARRFVRWLDRSDVFMWQLPRHAVEALKVNLKRLRTDEETANQRHGVSVFTIDQLASIYRVATEKDRLFILLGLNAGMAQAEITSLRCDEVEVQPPTIKRIRRKSGVYSEFALWPETWAALESRISNAPRHEGLVLVTQQGNPYNRQRIANAWTALEKRIRADPAKPVPWWLPFKHLRKTAAQLVRDESDGEIAGVFLSHGKPVATDDLADLYSNRPFHRVAEALGKVRKRLEPMFA